MQELLDASAKGREAELASARNELTEALQAEELAQDKFQSLKVGDMSKRGDWTKEEQEDWASYQELRNSRRHRHMRTELARDRLRELGETK